MQNRVSGRRKSLFPEQLVWLKKNLQAFKHSNPSVGCENELFYKAKCMFTTISQSLAGHTFIRRSLLCEVKRMMKGMMKEGGARERGG